jgi:TPR repeat protein
MMAIEKGNPYAMYNIAIYYHRLGEYDEMKKYYLMSIEKGNYRAMHNLGVYYYDTKNYEEMKKAEKVRKRRNVT